MEQIRLDNPIGWPDPILMRMVKERVMDVLLVEDNPAHAALVVELLVCTGEGDLRVVGRSALRPALAHLASEPCDVVLLDLDLPDSSGLDSLRRLKACAPTLPVIVLTDRRHGATLGAEALALGADEVFPKDELQAEFLGRTVRHAVLRQRRLNERDAAVVTAERRLATIIDALPQAMLVIDYRNRVLLANAAAGVLLGRPVRELTGSDFPYPLEYGQGLWEISVEGGPGRWVTPRCVDIPWGSTKALLVTLNETMPCGDIGAIGDSRRDDGRGYGHRSDRRPSLHQAGGVPAS